MEGSSSTAGSLRRPRHGLFSQPAVLPFSREIIMLDINNKKCYKYNMVKHFKDKEKEKIYNRDHSKNMDEEVVNRNVTKKMPQVHTLNEVHQKDIG